MNNIERFLEKLAARETRIAVVGLGYVGLPVAVSFAEAGFEVTGVDVDEAKVASLSEGKSFLLDVADERVSRLVESGRFKPTTSLDALDGADALLICVPTPLSDGVPDLSFVVAAGEAIGPHVSLGSLVVLESTTYPGTTEEILRPLLEVGGLQAGTDFFLAFSPERIDPGNAAFDFTEIPKIVGGVNEESTKAGVGLYEQVVPKVFAVSGTREAELAKLIENTFRHVNIGLVNELAVYAHDLGIDIWESIEAAATKPFGFLPFWPGPGWGGHCIPLDPAYLSWRVRRARAHEVRFVELAHAVNSEMPRYVVERVTLMLNDHNRAVRGAHILGIGMAYKGGTDDTRESPGLKVLAALAKRGAEVSYHDPLVPEIELDGNHYRSVALEEGANSGVELVLILAPQTGVDWDYVASLDALIFDCCNVLKVKGSNIIKL